ncbi:MULTISPECIES: glycosyl hydrolase family 8 [unclassified Streptomyces]|uniref:glycosyl hydrolase family 8 n=1 Tax=unclassified Streptomyces TaxID=2593676 RepID=UPI001655787D|nr:glycosyl hydrolase family 8 [Streptomyces sp. CB02980]MCB8901724.1 discoidin domain-containing protein [Streptomyces sp. CB02980]
MRRRSVSLLGLAGLLALPLTVLPQAQAADSLVSTGKAVTASSVETSAFGPGLAVDGSAATRWASLEGVDPQWIRIDLGAGHTISRVKLNWEDAYGKTYKIQTSADGSTWSDVYSTTAGDGATDDLTVSGSGRYVRMYGTGRGTAYGYSLWEFEVYGAPTGTGGGGGTAVPFGSHLKPYAAGTLKPSGSQATLDQKVVDYYNRWKSAFVRQNCGNGWYQIISPDADHPYVAEAQGYGMVVAATMAGADPDAKKIFDGLVKWKIDHPSAVNPNLLAAEQDVDCRSVNGGDGATDGDMDVAYGLLLADKQWGSTGTYNYKDLALKHIAAIKKDELNPTTKLLKLGDWSSSGDQYYYISRTSDWMVDHFRAFRTASGDTTWDAVRTAHQTQISRLQSTYASGTGLLPDFVVDTNTTPRPAPGQVLEDPNDGAYWWNACRTPWRIADDAVTSGDATSLAAARKVNSWIKTKTGGDPNKIAIGYKLNGTQISAGSEAAFFAPFAVAAMTDSGSQAWLDALWNKMLATPIDTSSYFSASIQLQVMITASGNHWVP